MKVGDNLICKQNVDFMLTKGKVYKIYDFFILYDRELVLIRDNENCVEYFYKNITENRSTIPVFYDYFYTEQEGRMMKLEKINNKI